MIDTVDMQFGGVLGTTTRLVRGEAEPVADPVRLDLFRLHDRHEQFGELTQKTYVEGKRVVGGKWQVGNIGLLYDGSGRLTVRASIPKLVTGDDNDVVLDERAAHHGLAQLVELTNELIDGCGVIDPRTRVREAAPVLRLREGTPKRIDSVYQWDVDSVAFKLGIIEKIYNPPRLTRELIVNAYGGRTLYYGKATKRVMRFYDKGAEVAQRRTKDISAHLPPGSLEGLSDFERRQVLRKAKDLAREAGRAAENPDVILRFEIQDRRAPHIRSIHERGWTALDIRETLQRAIGAIGTLSGMSFAQLLDTYDPNYNYRVHDAAACLYFVEHPEALAVVRNRVSRRAHYLWRKKLREAAKISVGDWVCEIPDDAFESYEAPLWQMAPAA